MIDITNTTTFSLLKKYRHLPTSLLLFVLSFPCLCWGSITESNKQQLKTVQQHILAKEKDVKKHQQQRDSLERQLAQQEKSIAAISLKLHATQQSLSTLNKQITQLTQSITASQQQEKQQKTILAQQLDSAFRQGQHSSLQFLFSGEKVQRDQRILAYFGYLNDARQQTIDKLTAIQQTLAQDKTTLEKKQAEQTQLLTQQKQQQQQFTEQQKNRKKTLADLEKILAKDKQQLVQLRRNEQQLRNKIAQAEKAARAKAQQEAETAEKIRRRENEAKRTGQTYKLTQEERALMARTGGLGRPNKQWLWPLQGPVLHYFGEPLQGELRWKGMVIAAPIGTQIRAIASGRVLLASWLQGYGLVIVIDHGKGDMSIYGYNQTALVTAGSKVNAGQAIAQVGNNSGGQERGALYFEIRRQGKAVNPLPWLRR